MINQCPRQGLTWDVMFIGTLWEKIKSALQNQACLLCSHSLNSTKPFCDQCVERLNFRDYQPILELAFGQIHAATQLNPEVKRLLYGHKFYKRQEYVPQLTGMLVHYWESSLSGQLDFKAIHPENVLVAPIPPHTGTTSKIDLFASRFARHFGYDYRYDLLNWMREVRPQHHIHEKQDRYSNVAQSLRLKSGIIASYRKVIIVDDLTTTGATLMEAGRAFQDESGQSLSRKQDLICLAISHVPFGSQTRQGQSL